MEINLLKLQTRLVIALFFSSFFGLISFGDIGSLSLTIPFIVAVLLSLTLILGVAFGRSKLSQKRIIIFIILSISVILSTLLSKYGSNFKSCFLYIFYFSLYAFIDKRLFIEDLEKYLRGFVIVSSILALYGLYQFVAYNIITFLPLKELIPEGLWASGMNTVAKTHIGFINGYSIRAHSIYAEPSIFSQYCAVAIIFILSVNNIKKKDKIIALIINVIGMIVSLSGTGIIVLIAGFFSLLLYQKKKIKRLYIALIVVLIAIYLLINDSPILSYYMERSSELFNSSSYSSGNYRFILPFKIGIANPWGYGVGNDDIAMNLVGAYENNITNGFGKILVEMGFIGLIEVIIFFFTLYPRKKSRQLDYCLFFIAVAMNIVGTFMLPQFWAFALLLCSNNGKRMQSFSQEDNSCYECDNNTKL